MMVIRKFNYVRFFTFIAVLLAIIIGIIVFSVSTIKKINYKKTYDYKLTQINYSESEIKEIKGKLNDSQIDKLLTMKYDENILRYLMINYEGTAFELRKLWKAATDLELDTKQIMERILRQIQYTGAMIPDRDSILINYAQCEGHDVELVNELLLNIAYEYFVYEAVICPEIFDMLYQNHKHVLHHNHYHLSLKILLSLFGILIMALYSI